MLHLQADFYLSCTMLTIYWGTLTKGKSDEFDKSDSNYQTKTTQNKATAISATVFYSIYCWSIV